MNKAKKKALKDIKEVNAGEEKRMWKNKSLKWKIRSILCSIEYWCVAFGFPICIAVGILTGDFYKALALWVAIQIYNTAANMRGFFLHCESYIEYQLGETI